MILSKCGATTEGLIKKRCTSGPSLNTYVVEKPHMVELSADTYALWPWDWKSLLLRNSYWLSVWQCLCHVYGQTPDQGRIQDIGITSVLLWFVIVWERRLPVSASSKKVAVKFSFYVNTHEYVFMSHVVEVFLRWQKGWSSQNWNYIIVCRHHPLVPRWKFLTVWTLESPASASSVLSSSGMWRVRRSESQSCLHWNQRQSEVAAVHQRQWHLWDAHVSHRPVRTPPVQPLQTHHLPHSRVQAHGIPAAVAGQHREAAAGQGRHEPRNSGLELRSCQRELF